MDDPADASRPAAADDDLPAREAAYEKFVWDNLRRNYLAHYLHGMLGMTGFRLINAPTFLPAYLHAVSGSNAIVGLGLALQQLGGIISPIFGATKVEHRTKVMPAALWMGGLGRLAILGMAAAGWMLSGQPLVVALLFFIFMFGVFMGAQRVVFSLLMSKVIPLSRRGRLQAWRNATGGAIAAVLAYFAGKYFVGKDLFGNGYSTTFAFAFLLTSAGLWALQVLMKEPEPPTTRPRARFRDRLREFPALIAEDRAYGFFLLVQMLTTSARIATPFYILYVGRMIGADGAMLGLLSFAFLGADTAANLVWGYLGDKTGFRLVLLISLLGWIGATLLLLNVHEVWATFMAFAGLGAASSGYMMAAQTMILEFGARDDLPMRIAVSATAESITATAGPLLGGLVAEAFGYTAVFGASLAFLGAALVILILAVQDPRRRT
ncbi:permease of the major facilitator superfamily [Phenylobacterium zucineum HLK1]|uniref:Permease of the major facilitator superfamily n=1 Tax=Phenylobacterium zucineum (strain HLK1) TaxID=450851 RepID=B4RGU4_PHEZH|nr:MFS transporter [Phenylobacterium zucineum]ACG77310.1 permease of the major facilitator superfamily [Phenylobacterium zucineum HLK1]